MERHRTVALSIQIPEDAKRFATFSALHRSPSDKFPKKISPIRAGIKTRNSSHRRFHLVIRSPHKKGYRIRMRIFEQEP